MGNSFGLANEAPPTLTAGVVSSLTYLQAGDAGGRLEFVYTSAAVNPGVNGGPLVDVEGRLVGTVSTYLAPLPAEPYQFLGKVVPADRLRAAYADLPESAEVFPPPETGRPRSPESAALELVLHTTARRAAAAVVSLEVERSQPLSSISPGRGGVVPTMRYAGPVSGLLVEEDGWILTSLYNLTNTATLVTPGWKPPAEAELEAGLRAIQKVTVHVEGGGRTEARLIAHDSRLGVALLKADLAALAGGDPELTRAVKPLPVAPPETYVEGRLVLALGKPFGANRNPDPLLTFGILSKRHADSVQDPWRGQWQTDAGATDANVGGAVVDLHGRLLGMLQIWTPTRHGRNSGIGFVVTGDRIAASLPALKEGRSLERGFLGVVWAEGSDEAAIGQVSPDSPAAAAGLRPGDRIIGVDGASTPKVGDVVGRLLARWAGERVVLRIARGSEELDVEVELRARVR
jgi:serine protease Do